MYVGSDSTTESTMLTRGREYCTILYSYSESKRFFDDESINLLQAAELNAAVFQNFFILFFAKVVDQTTDRTKKKETHTRYVLSWIE